MPLIIPLMLCIPMLVSGIADKPALAHARTPAEMQYQAQEHEPRVYQGVTTYDTSEPETAPAPEPEYTAPRYRAPEFHQASPIEQAIDSVLGQGYARANPAFVQEVTRSIAKEAVMLQAEQLSDTVRRVQQTFQR